MPTLEERVAYLEGKTEEHSHGFGDIRDLLIHRDGRIDALDHKIDRFRDELASRIDNLDANLSTRINNLDTSLSTRIDGTNARIDNLDVKFSRYFLWTIGIQITVLLAVIGALLVK